MSQPNVITALAAAARTATTIWDPILDAKLQGVQNSLFASPATNLDFDALIAYLNITVVPGVDTVLLALQEQEPVSGSWFDVPGAVSLAQVATGLVTLRVGTGFATVAPGVGGATLSMVLPPRWRLRVVHSAGTSFTYSLAAGLYKTAE